MENALRACCKGIKIGKILIHGEGKSGRQVSHTYQLPVSLLNVRNASVKNSSTDMILTLNKVETA